MINAHIIDFYHYHGTILTQKYIRSDIEGVILYQDMLKKEIRSVIGDVLNLKKDCKSWDPMFNGLKGYES
jgi:hypothetical protein